MNLFKIKRNKLNRQEAFNFEKRSRFGIRKLTIGVVSLVIGSGMVLNGVEQVYAGTDADNGEIRHVRNGSPKEMAEGSAVPGTIAEKANYRDYKIETVPVVVDGVQYVDVTLTFNERGRAYSKNRFYVFNMPNSLYEPKVITREVYQQAVEESQARVGNQTYTDYKVVASVKTSTLTTSGWREEPTNVAPGTERWGVNYRYINGNPKSSAYNSRDNTMKQIIGPGNNNSGEAISWIYTSEAGYNNDWDRLISHGFDRKAEVVSEFKNKSNSIYIDQARHSREKVVYKFRARVKDQNADMNFIFGMNEMIVNGHANFVAKYGKTPDNRPYKERFPVNTPAKITVDNTSNLTRDNKLAIIAKIKEANSSLFGSDNSLKTPILIEPTEADIPTNATSGNITLRYTDGSTTTIPVANTVRQKVVATNNPAPTFGDFGVNTTVGSSTYKTIFVFGAKTNGSEVVEYAPDFVPDNATGGIPVQDNTGIAKVELIGIDNENKVTNTGIAFTPEGKLLGEFDRNQSTNLVRNGINGVWHHRIKATDNGNPAKSAITSTIRIKAYRVEKTDETAIAKVYGTALTQDELTNKLRVAVSSGMTVPADNHSHKVAGYTPENGQFTAITNISELPTSGNYTVKMETTNVYGQTIVNNIAVDYNEQKDVIEPIAPTQQVLIDNPRPTTETDKNALINALKEANKTPEGTSKFPENTTFDVAENGTVTITYPDRSSEQVTVPFKQKDSAQHTPVVAETPFDSATTAGTPLTETERNAVKAAVTVPNFPAGDRQPTITVPADARVTDGTNGNTGKPVVVATVEYPDGTTEQVEVPVRQRDNAKYEATVTNPDTPAAIKASHETGSQITDQEDKNAILAKVSVPAGSNGTPSLDQNPVVEVKDGKPVVKVTVTYSDQTKDEVYVPVDQKDNETHTPTAPAAEAPVAITGSDAPDAPIAEADKPAILNSVTVPAVDGGQAPKVTKEITSPVKVVDGKAFVEVTVTYPDKTSEVIPVPVNQKDNEANTPTVTAPEKPAPISVPVAENTPVETDADKKLITDKVNVAGLPNPPQSVKVAEPAKVVLDQAGNPVVNVEVTYPDGTKDIVPVPVKQADNQTNTPSLKDPEVGKPAEVLVAIDPTPGVAINNPMDKEAIAAKVDLSKLPAGTTAEVADGAVVANDPLTNKPVVPVTVTYPDGTSETINVPVKQADNLAMDPSLKDTNPVPILTEATVGLTVSDKANLDAIVAKVDPKTGKAEVVNNTIVAGKEDGPHAGQPVVNVLVTYPDGTQDTIEVPVKQADNVVKEPSLTDQTPVPIQAAATTGTTVPADDKPAILAKVDLPAGAEATIADDATVVREDGQAVVPVTVTYPDGTTDTISVPVKRADNSKYTPSQVTDTVQVDAATAPGTAITSQDDKDAIIAAVTVPKVAAGEKAPVVSLLENTQVEVVNDQPVVKAIVTYADGTTDTVDVPIVQKVSATKEPSLKETEPGKPAQAVITENPTAGKAITDPADQKAILDKVVVPEGGKASIADDAVVEMDGDQPVLPVTVTYTDGSKDIIKVPVKQADNVAKEPSLKNQTPVGVMDAPAVGAQVEESTDLEAIKNNVDTKGGTASIEDPTIVEGPNNQPAVAVTVTYPDGTTDTILVPIKTADNVTYTPVLKSTVPVLVSVATDNGTAVPGADQAKILANVDVPALTADGDKPAVALSIENPVVLQKNGQAGVEVTVTYQDGSKDKIFVPVDSDTDKDGFSNKEEEKAGTNATDPSSTPAGQDSAERLNPGLTEPVEVKNPDKLTDAEKEAVKKAVEDSNDLPAGTTVSVANDGTVTVTYPDNSTDTIKPKDAVTQFVDTDGDGISDRQETENGTDPSKVDSDNDGFSDKEEVERGTDPTKADSKPASSETDTDGDGISNEDEVARGTDPNKSDTDGDGFSDQEEITAGSNPTKADSTPANVDKDGDGFTDTEEAAAGTDANNPASTPAGQDSADRLNPGLTEPVEVKNPDKLTDAEKESVKKAVEDSNDLPEGTEVTVSDNGTVTVTYPDKSTDTIQPAETVKVAKDTDKDGFTDTEEATAGTSATDPSSTPAGQDSAGQLTPSLAEPVEVKNPDKLTDAEKESVKKA
ncbi:hypothetical protein XK27_01190, partial [Streptococcus suis]